MFKSKPILNQEETSIKEVIEMLLSKKDTIIDVEPEKMSFLISNETYSYFLSVDSQGIKLCNHSFAIHKRFNGKVIDVYKGLISAEKTRRWKEKEDKIFSNAMELLDKIKTNLQ